MWKRGLLERYHKLKLDPSVRSPKVYIQVGNQAQYVEYKYVQQLPLSEYLLRWLEEKQQLSLRSNMLDNYCFIRSNLSWVAYDNDLPISKVALQNGRFVLRCTCLSFLRIDPV